MPQNWTEIQPTIYGNPELSKKARIQAARQTKLRDLVDLGDDFYIGKKAGDTVGYLLVGEISGESTTPLGEFTPVPFSKPSRYTGTAQVQRYANAIAYTGTFEDLDRISVDDVNIDVLTKHAARTINKLISNELIASRSFTYSPTSATAGSFKSDGTVTQQTTSDLTLYHLQDIARLGQKYNMPYADGENYLTCLSPTAAFGILKERALNGFLDISKYDPKRVSGALKNEIGTVCQHRIVVDNHSAAVADGIGAGSAYGSGFVVGYEGIKEVTVYPVHFRYNGNLGGDFGNQAAIAWQMLCTWAGLWNYTTHGQGSILHITSA